jgi:hypothetical protein
VKDKTRNLIEGVSESTAACLLTMVQGNILALTLGHLVIASQTGIIAGLAAFTLSLLARVKGHWVTPVILGVCTAIVDFYTHPGSFGAVATEAIVTGMAAAILSFLIGVLVRRVRASTTTGDVSPD